VGVAHERHTVQRNIVRRHGETDYYARVDRKTNGAWTFVQSPEAAPNAWGWDIDVKQPPYNDLGGNFLAHTIITRIPGQPDSAIILPDTIPGKGHGYRIFFEDHVKGTYKEAIVPITPASKNANDLAFHLQAIHLGVAGPSLLYCTTSM